MAIDHRKNNFDFLRLLFAIFVIVSHSYILSGGDECDPLCKLTNGQVVFSYIGVKGFFVISGYLIFQSLQRSKNIVDYFWKRFLRLFPALFVVLLLTVLLAPFVYESSVPYLENKSLLTYLPRNLILYGNQTTIDGVFEKNPFKSTINGSLWTIPYEFTMYVLLGGLLVFRKYKRLLLTLLAGAFVIMLVGNLFYLEKAKEYNFLITGVELLDLGCFFVAGSLLAALNFEKIPRKKELLLLLSVVLIASFYFGFFSYTKYITLPLWFLLLGLLPVPFINSIGDKIGDLSYGIYIYGFPVQQTLMYFFKPHYGALMLYSLAISSVLAYFSWHYVEKRALRWKKVFQ